MIVIMTEKQIYDLNNMNVAAQNVSLGDTLEAVLEAIEDVGGNSTAISGIQDEITAIKARLDALEQPAQQQPAQTETQDPN